MPRVSRAPSREVYKLLFEYDLSLRSELGSLLQDLTYFVGDVERFLLAEDRKDKKAVEREKDNMRCRLKSLKEDLERRKG